MEILFFFNVWLSGVFVCEVLSNVKLCTWVWMDVCIRELGLGLEWLAEGNDVLLL